MGVCEYLEMTKFRHRKNYRYNSVIKFKNGKIFVKKYSQNGKFTEFEFSPTEIEKYIKKKIIFQTFKNFWYTLYIFQKLKKSGEFVNIVNIFNIYLTSF